MTSLPNGEYVKTCQIIETFGCFFEKLTMSSSDPTKNIQSLLQFKQALYNNLDSQDKLASALKPMCGEVLITTKETSKMPLHPTKSSYDESYSKLSSHPSVRDSTSQKKSGSHSDVDSAPEKIEGRQIPGQEGFSDKLQDHKVLITEYLSISQLMPRIKAASHNEIAKLFSLNSTYSNARSFSEHQYPVLSALCFCFFEKLLHTKAKEAQNMPLQTLEIQLNNDPELYSMRGTELFGFIKGLLQNYSESNVIQKLYDHAAANPKVYHSTVLTFKRLILENLPRRLKTPEVESLDWLNDIDNVEPALLHGISRLFRVSVKFLILTKEKLFERIALADDPLSSKYDSPRDIIDLTIFYDKNLSAAYILYPIDKAPEEGSKSPFSQKNKARPSFTNNQIKSSIDSELIKPPKTLNNDKVSSLAALDTVSTTPVISLTEVDNADHPPSHKSNIPHFDQPKKFTNVEGTASSFRDSYSTPHGRGGVGTGRPSFEKALMSPHSGSKENRFHLAKDLEALEERLTPKEKDITPLRPHSHFTSNVNAGEEEKFSRLLTEKSRNEYNRQNYSPYEGKQPHYSAQKMGKEDGKVFSFGRSATQEYSTGPSSAGLRLKAELLGQRGHQAEISSRHPSLRGLQEPSAVKIIKIPGSLQVRFDKVTQLSSQCEQEFDGLVIKYLKKERISGSEQTGTKKTLPFLTTIYNNIVGENKENRYHRAMTGPY